MKTIFFLLVLWSIIETLIMAKNEQIKKISDRTFHSNQINMFAKMFCSHFNPSKIHEISQLCEYEFTIDIN